MFWAVHVNSSAYYHEPVSGHERSRKMYAWVWSLPPAVSKFWQFQKCHLKARVHQERVGLQLYPSKLLRLSMLTDHPDSSVTKKKTVWKFVPESMLHPPNTHTHKNVIQGLFLGKQYGSCWTVSHWGMRCCVSLSPLCSTVCSCPSFLSWSGGRIWCGPLSPLLALRTLLDTSFSLSLCRKHADGDCRRCLLFHPLDSTKNRRKYKCPNFFSFFSCFY